MTEYIEVTADTPRVRTGQIKLYGPEAFEGMRAAGRVSAQVLAALEAEVRPGVTTKSLDDFARDMIISLGATPANLGYRGFAHTTCISINHVVCHGLPSDRVLKDGDILNIDLTSVIDGYHGDTSRMYVAGQASTKAKRLIQVTKEALDLGIAAAKPGNTVGDIGHAIEAYAKKHRYGVVEEFVGHGVGLVYHDAPDIMHYGDPRTGPELKPGMIFTIEPMLNLGKAATKTLDDNWTVVTRDRSLSAQFEHSIGITETGCEIFTQI